MPSVSLGTEIRMKMVDSYGKQAEVQSRPMFHVEKVMAHYDLARCMICEHLMEKLVRNVQICRKCLGEE